MKHCPECGAQIMASNIEKVYGCSNCKQIFQITKVKFDLSPIKEPSPPQTKGGTEKPYVQKDLTTIPKPTPLEPIGEPEEERVLREEETDDNDN